MVEKLKWLSENMPDGWRINEDEHEGLALRCSSPWQWIPFVTGCGDIGLAPVTALLKQELRGSDDLFMDSYSNGDHFVRTSAFREAKGMGDTEFEAVFEAYQEMKK